MNNEQTRQQKAKQQRLSLVCIANLIIELFSVVTEVTDPRHLLHEGATGDDLDLRFCVDGDFSDSEIAQESTATSREAMEALRCHNHCVFVCKVFAGLLAWLIETLHLPATASEADVREVLEFRPVVCFDFLTGERISVASLHTMLKIVSLDGYHGAKGPEESELFLDASAPQFLRPAGLYTVKNYPIDPETLPIQPRNASTLGAAYMVHLQHLRDGSGVRNFRLEAIIRTVNNEVWRKMNGPGWHDDIVDEDDSKWNGFEQEVLASVKTSLQGLVANLDRNPIPGNFDRESQHKLMARISMGTGHTKIAESLERVSGVEVTRLQNF